MKVTTRARAVGARHPARLCVGALSICLFGLLACGTEPGAEELERQDAGSQKGTRTRADAGRVDAGAAGDDREPDESESDSEDKSDPEDEALGSEEEEPYDGDPSRPELCLRPGADRVRDLFCRGPRPEIDGLRSLQAKLGFEALPAGEDGPPVEADIDPNLILDTLVYLGHSTALSGHLVSPINPRAIMLGPDTILTFQRGIQQVELASRARDKNAFNFYLLSFQQACNDAPEGCTPGDLYTPSVESDWREIEVRDDEELKNTSFDCRQCHQRGREIPALLMRELRGPWTHFFALDPVGAPPDPSPGVTGRDLVQDFLRARGDEPYAGIPTYLARHTVGFILQNIVDTAQPLLFDSPGIEQERWPRGPDGYAAEPLPSEIWQRGYEAFKKGEQLPLPHYEQRPTDPEKQAKLTEAYARYRAGELAADALPDLADIFPDDPKLRAEIGLQVEPDASPAEALVQACGSCHNDVLDQSISRARFNIDLSRMSRAELDLAIERLQLPAKTAGVMPPPEARQLDARSRERLLAYLRQDTRPAEDALLLKRAAELGMAGGGGGANPRVTPDEEPY